MSTSEDTQTYVLQKLRFVVLFALFFVAFSALAQTAPTGATKDEIDRWLRSGDPRMVAWGAYFG